MGNALQQDDSARREPIMLGLKRAFDQDLRRERSSLWTSMFLALSKTARSGAEYRQCVQDVLWNLRTWPLELIDWRRANSQRLDIRYKRDAGRFNNKLATTVIP